MEDNYKDISKLKAQLAEALILRIENSDDFSPISLEQLSVDIKTDIDLIFSVVSDENELILYWLNEEVSKIFTGLVGDFSDDNNASTQEKILETLMSIFEVFDKKRQIVRYIHQWALKDINFGVSFGTFIYNICDRILVISGDKKRNMLPESSFRSVRVKGLMFLIIRIIPIWLKDDSDDLSVTYREIDQSLKQARELAENFHII